MHKMVRVQPTQRRCGEMADATDLKSVGLNRPVWVRVPPSAGAGREPALRREAPSEWGLGKPGTGLIGYNPASRTGILLILEIR